MKKLKIGIIGCGSISNEKLDIVHICLPTYLHAGHAAAAMERGMNVFMEKPVCLKRSEAKQLLEVQKQTGSKVMIGQVVRFFDEYIYLRELYETPVVAQQRYFTKPT